MSSIRSFSQIPVGTKFFITTQEYDPIPSEGESYDDPSISFSGGYPGAYIQDGSLGSVSYPAFIKGALLKDMGRSTTIVDAAGNHLAVYREVQRVRSAATEGVGGSDITDGPYGTFFVKVWGSDGNNVYVARIG